MPGLWLVPVLVIAGGLGTGELLQMMAAGGVRPVAWTVDAGNFLVLASLWGPWVERCLPGQPSLPTHTDATLVQASGDWVLLAFAAAVILVFVGEMRRYKEPGGVTANLAGAVLAIAYIGVLLSFAVRLRLQWGIGALASLVIVAKVGDTGAYFVGRLLGRHKMSPILSPKKTVEGAVGALVFSLAASWATFQWLVPAVAAERPREAEYGPLCWGWITFALAVGVAGVVGDWPSRSSSGTRAPRTPAVGSQGWEGSSTCSIPCCWLPRWHMGAGPSESSGRDRPAAYPGDRASFPRKISGFPLFDAIRERYHGTIG